MIPTVRIRTMTYRPSLLSGALLGLALLFPAVVTTVTVVGSLVNSAPMPSVSVDMVLLQLGLGAVYTGRWPHRSPAQPSSGRASGAA